jgi:hypothetical protein
MRIRFLCFSGVHDLFGSLLECRSIVRPISQRRLNYLFSINKVRNKWLSDISPLWIYHYLFPLSPIFWVFFISLILILQMVNTRNRVIANNTENNGESNNQKANPPPPPLLTLEQVLAMQAQMLQTM